MDQNAAKQKIIEVMAQILGVAPGEINDDSSMDTIEAWDSLKHMKLVIALEQELGLEFDDEEVVELLSFRLIELSVAEKFAA
ncbi:MAG: acyl carrier protein [Magnetovibrio sp.]|nr:acyl carrier protein [Magnetovibrio sp.]